MRKLYLFFFLLSSLFCYSQQNVDEELQLYLSDYKNFNFEELKNKHFKFAIDTVKFDVPQFYHNLYSKIVTRDLDFGVEESIYIVRISYLENDGAIRRSPNELHVLSKDTTIIGIICLDKSQDIITSYYDEFEIQQYITKHDSLYQTTTQVGNLINDLTEKWVYGYSCGIAPVMGDVHEKYGLKFDDIKNIEVFRRWLRSYNPELQAYGVDAISHIYKQPKFTIGKKQEELEKNDKNLVKHIKARSSIINTCSGCFTGIYQRVF